MDFLEFGEDIIKAQESKENYYAFKGFDKDLKCRGFAFEVGKEFSKEPKESIKLCSEDGFHYCDKLNQVFSHYQNDGKNRFCLIQVTGIHKKDYDKCITTSFKIIREVTDELNDLLIEDNLCLPTVKSIQQRYPFVHVGGSCGLFLHGIKLKRILKATQSSDVDLVAPFFILFEGDENNEVEYKEARASGNDFDETFIYNGDKVDIRIDPKQRYEIIEYRGFKYKVSPLEVIIDAKVKYALNGQSKHKNDLYEMLGKKVAGCPINLNCTPTKKYIPV